MYMYMYISLYTYIYIYIYTPEGADQQLLQANAAARRANRTMSKNADYTLNRRST